MEKENITNIEEGSIQHKLMFHDALIQDVNERIYVDSVKMGIIESRISALRLEHMAHVINRSRDVFLHEIQELESNFVQERYDSLRREITGFKQFWEKHIHMLNTTKPDNYYIGMIPFEINRLRQVSSRNEDVDVDWILKEELEMYGDFRTGLIMLDTAAENFRKKIVEIVVPEGTEISKAYIMLQEFPYEEYKAAVRGVLTQIPIGGEVLYSFSEEDITDYVKICTEQVSKFDINTYRPADLIINKEDKMNPFAVNMKTFERWLLEKEQKEFVERLVADNESKVYEDSDLEKWGLDLKKMSKTHLEAFFTIMLHRVYQSTPSMKRMAEQLQAALVAEEMQK